MATRDKPPVLVVLQLTGGNDYMNTVVPYTDPNYHDSRTTLGIDQESVLKVDDELGFHPNMGPVKEIYDRGDMAVIHGVGYANSPRSHFRSMDIWHTCEPDIIGTEGWLGRALRDLDPVGENPVTGGQHRPGYAQGYARSRRIGRVRRRPFDLRTAHQHRAARAPRQDADPGSSICTGRPSEPARSRTTWARPDWTRSRAPTYSKMDWADTPPASSMPATP